MPLNRSCSLEAFQANIAKLVDEGRPQAQAYAIAVSMLKKACGTPRAKSLIAMASFDQPRDDKGRFASVGAGAKTTLGGAALVETVRAQEAWENGLSDAESNAVLEWRSQGFRGMRAADAGVPTDEANHKKLANLKSALDKAPFYEGELYRGVQVHALVAEKFTKVGSIVSDEALSSWSGNTSVGRSFAQIHRDKDASILMVLKPGHGVARLITRSAEMESLVPKGTKLRVTKVTNGIEGAQAPRGKQTQWTVELEAVETGVAKMAFEDRLPGPIPKAALAYLKAKLLKPSFNYSEVWGEEHKYAFTVAKVLEADVLATVKDSLEKALAGGQTWQAWRKGIAETLSKSGWGQLVPDSKKPHRLYTIYQTNMRVARAQGQWQRVERTKKTHPYLEYVIGPSKVHRPDHAELAGTVLPVDDPFWDTHMPPNGFGCRCSVRQLSAAEAERRGISESPDETPTVEWKLPDGTTQMLPPGVSPGWDFNPGKQREEQLDEAAALSAQ